MEAGRLAAALGRQFAVAAVVGLCPVLAGMARADVGRVESLPCWGPAMEGVETRCYLLGVPENRTRPYDREIQLAVAILLPEDTPDGGIPAPLVHLSGGPGWPTGLSGETFTFWQDWYAGWIGRQNRSLILVDQRGTGESEPRLQCDPAIAEPTEREYFKAPVPPDARVHAAWLRDYMQACRRRFDAAGIDVAAYNTAESAADFAALRRALGLAEWDVWGVSYGGDLALELLRIDGQGVRSLILDSVSLYGRPDLVIGNAAANFDRALTMVARDCLSDESCANTYFALQSGFATGLAWLNTRPETLRIAGGPGQGEMQYLVDGRRAAELLFLFMYDPASVPYMPAALSAVVRRDRTAFRFFAEYMLALSDALPVSDVARTSAICRAAPRGEALARLRHDEGRFPSYAALWSADYIAAVCPDWGADPADPAELGPVYSDVPALILGGRYDPVTPPEWGELAAQSLPNSTVIEFPHLSHGSLTMDVCADTIAARFLEDPEEDPRDGCLDGLAPPAFLLP